VDPDGNEYYRDSNGALLRDLANNVAKFESSARYMFDTHTGMLRKGLFQDPDGNWFCCNGEGEVHANGTLVQSGERYRFDDLGKAITGMYSEGGNTYCYGSDGKMLTGLATVDNKTYYFQPGTGEMRHGFVDAGDSTWYLLDESDGTIMTGLRWIGDELYYFSTSDGKCASGAITTGGKEYLFDSVTRQAARGKTNGNKFYHPENGQRMTGAVTYPVTAPATDGDGKTIGYASGSGGGLLTGAVTLDGKEFYFSASHERVDGLVSIDNKPYYFDPAAGKQKNKSFTAEGIHYKADSNGVITIPVTASSTNAEKMLSKGLTYLGTPYGSNLTTMVDCSGLVKLSLADAGITACRSAAQQWADFGAKNTNIDSPADLRPGDLIFYTDFRDDCELMDTTGCETVNEVHHVGIYAGSGQILEASNRDGNKSTLIRQFHDHPGSFICRFTRVTE
jgi:glucan-binding YG repeat protein